MGKIKRIQFNVYSGRKMVFNLGSFSNHIWYKITVDSLLGIPLCTYPNHISHSLNIELTDTVHMIVYARGRDGPTLKFLNSTRDRKENKKRKYLLQATSLVTGSNSRRNQRDLLCRISTYAAQAMCWASSQDFSHFILDNILIAALSAEEPTYKQIWLL